MTGMMHSNRMEAGQSMAEFALVTPVLILLLFGMTFAAFYAFRTAASDWGVFITGAAAGAYGGSQTERARQSIFWNDIAADINTAPLAARTRSVISTLDFRNPGKRLLDIQLTESQQGTVIFRLWQFYPGPPEGLIQ